MPIPLTSVAIDGEALRFVEGFQFKSIHGTGNPKLPTEQSNGWLEVSLPYHYLYQIQTWLHTQPKVLTFSTESEKARYEAFRVRSPPIPEAEEDSLLLVSISYDRRA